MKFLNKILEKLPEYKLLRKATAVKGAYAVTGLSAVHKAHIINSLPFSLGMGAFVVVSDEHEAQVMLNDLTAMGRTAYFYPMRDFIYKDIKSRSREY